MIIILSNGKLHVSFLQRRYRRGFLEGKNPERLCSVAFRKPMLILFTYVIVMYFFVCL